MGNLSLLSACTVLWMPPPERSPNMLHFLHEKLLSFKQFYSYFGAIKTNKPGFFILYDQANQGSGSQHDVITKLNESKVNASCPYSV